MPVCPTARVGALSGLEIPEKKEFFSQNHVEVAAQVRDIDPDERDGRDEQPDHDGLKT